MTEENRLTHYLVSDLGGLTRGRGGYRPGGGLASSVGWVPVNQLISPFDTIPSPNPYGSHGDCRLYPDSAALFEAALPDRNLRFALCDVGSLDGRTFSLCARSFLKRAVDRLAERGLKVFASFEQEFWLELPGAGPRRPGFSYQRAISHEPFGERLLEVLTSAGLEPEMLLAEFAPDQFELVLAPSFGVAAADRAVASREIVRAAAQAAGGDASFAPVRTPGGVGSGVHIHFSLWTEDGQPVLHDPAGPGGLSDIGAAFAAGVVGHMAALCALTAPSVVSYERLQPHRWSSAYTCLGDRNREATLRICPLVGSDPESARRQYNLEYRAADATANPYLALGGLLMAGLAGLEEGLSAPPLVNDDPSEADPAAMAELGVVRLPTSLDAALDALEADPAMLGWLGEDLARAYLLAKRHEADQCRALDAEAVCRRYADVF